MDLLTWLLLVALFVLGCAVIVMVDSLRAAKKRRSYLALTFGKVPDRQYRGGKPERYWAHLAPQTALEACVDDITWNDLDLDAVFERTNACLTTAGQECLYAMLRLPQPPEILEQRERLTALFEDETLREACRMALLKLGSQTAVDVPTLLFAPRNELQCPVSRLYAGAGALVLSLVVVLFAPQLGLVLLGCAAVHNARVYLRAQKQLAGQLESIGYLLRTARCGKKLCRALAASAPQLVQQWQQALRPAANIPFGGLSAGGKSDLDGFMQLLGMLTLLPVLQYCKAVRRLSAHREEFHHLWRLLGEVDCAIAVLSLRRSLPCWVRPEFLPQGQALSLIAREAVHPLMEDGVPNSAEVRQGWLLTGSNASGKSTFLKTLAVNCILAQTLHTCTARHFALHTAPVLSSMAIQDSLLTGESYFVAEVKSLRRVVALAEQKKPCYCFIDEILRGTNTIERVAAAYSVLGYLADGACLCMAATHDTELALRLAQRFVNMHFSETVTDDGVHFDYRLKTGVCTTRNALRLLEHYGFPGEVVAQAKELAHE